VNLVFAAFFDLDDKPKRRGRPADADLPHARW
jgi:hypothetical protein